MRIENKLLKKIAKLKERDARRGLGIDDELEDSHPPREIYALSNDQLKAYAFVPSFYLMALLTPVILSLCLDIAFGSNWILFAISFIMFFILAYLFYRVFYYILSKIEIIIDEEGIYTHSFLYKKLFHFQPIFWADFDDVQIVQFTGLMHTKFAHEQKFDRIRPLVEDDYVFCIIADSAQLVTKSAEADDKDNNSEGASEADKSDKDADKAQDKAPDKEATDSSNKADNKKKKSKIFDFKRPSMSPIIILASTSWQIADEEELLRLFDRLDMTINQVDMSSTSTRKVSSVSVDDKLVYAMNACLITTGLGIGIAWMDTYQTLSYGFYLYFPILFGCFAAFVFYKKFLHVDETKKRLLDISVSSIFGLCFGFLVTSMFVWIMPRVEKKHDAEFVLQEHIENEKTSVYKWAFIDEKKKRYKVTCRYDKDTVPEEMINIHSKVIKITESANMVRLKSDDICHPHEALDNNADDTPPIDVQDSKDSQAKNQSEHQGQSNEQEWFDINKPIEPESVDITDNNEVNDGGANDGNGSESSLFDKLMGK